MSKSETAASVQSSPKGGLSTLSTSIRLNEYTGLEVKTLWNHFSKDSLITPTELGALLERILIKDSTDLLVDIKKSPSWKKYASKVLAAMDTSKGETLDLSEFSGQFNRINQRRLYYFLRYLFPDILIYLRGVCEQMGLNESEMKDLDKILKGRGEEPLPIPVTMAEMVEEDTSDKDEIDRLNALLVVLESKVSELEALIRQEKEHSKEEQIAFADKQSHNAAEFDRLKRENEELRNGAVVQEKELKSAKEQLTELENAWKSDFEKIISENEELRVALEGSRTDINRLNTEVLRLSTELTNELNKSGKDVFKFTGTSLTGIDLDPLRTELVRRFGSIEAFVASLGKGTEKRGITLNELELLGVSMGYSREYCKKLFYTLDTNDRGIVSISQFGRPFPIINKDLCLLTKGEA